VFTAQQEAPDLLNDTRVGNQLEFKGRLFYSQDNYNLELLNKEHLTFILYGASYSNIPQTINLGTYGEVDNFINISSFALNTREIVPNHCELIYEYRTVGGAWQTFEPNVSNCLSSLTNVLYLRATLKSIQSDHSPILNLKNSSVTLESNSNEAVIISQMKSVASFKKINLFIDTILDNSNNIEVYFNANTATNNNPVWTALVKDPNYNQILDSSFNLRQLKFTFSNLTTIGSKFQYKIKLSATDKTKMPLVKTIYTYLD
jgi:hypothetical protein